MQAHLLCKLDSTSNYVLSGGEFSIHLEKDEKQGEAITGSMTATGMGKL